MGFTHVLVPLFFFQCVLVLSHFLEGVLLVFLICVRWQGLVVCWVLAAGKCFQQRGYFGPLLLHVCRFVRSGWRGIPTNTLTTGATRSCEVRRLTEESKRLTRVRRDYQGCT